MIGIYGGTFDPVHYGHLRTALEVKEVVGLDELRFLPCRQPPHRAQPQAAPEHRLAMLKLALADAEPGFRIDTHELERDGPSYMVDTLTSLRGEIGTSIPLCLIIGMDAFRRLTNWYRWRDLPALAHLIVMRRPEATTPLLDKELADWLAQGHRDHVTLLRQQSSGLVHFLDVTQLSISASGIRSLVRAGRSPRYLLPDAVFDYLRQYGLYQK